MIPFIQPGTRERQLRGALTMSVGALPGFMTLLWLNRSLYGSAFASGYGDAWSLFAVTNVSANVSNYASAIFQTQHVVPLVGVIAPFVFDGIRRKGSLLLLAFAAGVIVTYLLYAPFPEWWYVRFLIPAIVVLLVLASAVGVQLLSKAGMGGVIPIAAVVLGILGTRAAGDRQAFELQRMEGRYRTSANVVRERLPANAVLITEWESGSIRFHADREVVLWSSLDPAWLDRAITWLRSQGRQPYLLFERGEEGGFRARFREQSDAGALDWPPRFDLNRQVRIYDPADRARFLAGESYATENVPLRQGGGGRAR
jgi:hypothetical protein